MLKHAFFALAWVLMGVFMSIAAWVNAQEGDVLLFVINAITVFLSGSNLIWSLRMLINEQLS